MGKLKEALQFVKEHPWETGFVVMTGIAVFSLINANRVVKIANYQSKELDNANWMFADLAAAVKEGLTLAVTDEGFIDIIPSELSA